MAGNFELVMWIHKYDLDDVLESVEIKMLRKFIYS